MLNRPRSSRDRGTFAAHSVRSTRISVIRRDFTLSTEAGRLLVLSRSKISASNWYRPGAPVQTAPTINGRIDIRCNRRQFGEQEANDLGCIAFRASGLHQVSRRTNVGPRWRGLDPSRMQADRQLAVVMVFMVVYYVCLVSTDYCAGIEPHHPARGFAYFALS